MPDSGAELRVQPSGGQHLSERKGGWVASAVRRLIGTSAVRKTMFSRPVPARVHLLRMLDRHFDVLSYEHKLLYNTLDRPYYGYGMLRAAELARRLGLSRIAAVEFGVAGGNGLLSMERHALRVREVTGVTIETYGFDTGTGMPPPTDYRDLPYLWQEGYYQMDWNKLRRRLASSRVFLGPVERTLDEFLSDGSIPPVGFLAFDLDYYSSTMAAFRIFEAEYDRLLPRIACYFDDIVGDLEHAYNDFTGELRAIHDFNAAHEGTKIAAVRGLRFWGNRTPELWYEQTYIAHLFGHPDYTRPVAELTQLPLSS